MREEQSIWLGTRYRVVVEWMKDGQLAAFYVVVAYFVISFRHRLFGFRALVIV